MNAPIKKLEDTHKAVVINMLGAGCTIKEITNELQDQFSIDISERAVYYYKYEHREEVEKAKEQFLAKLEIIPISNKVYRQFRRQKLVDDLIDKGLWCEMETASGFKYKKGLRLDRNELTESHFPCRGINSIYVFFPHHALLYVVGCCFDQRPPGD